MKRNIRHIIKAWLLLLCFAAGQYAIYAHSHTNIPGKITFGHQRSAPQKSTVSDNCPLCDAMHHNFMTVGLQAFFAPVQVNEYHYITIQHDIISVKLVRSAGRSPPLA